MHCKMVPIYTKNIGCTPFCIKCVGPAYRLLGTGEAKHTLCDKTTRLIKYFYDM